MEAVYPRQSQPASSVEPHPATVLLVDDEPELLAGLRRVIRLARPRWQILLATSGSQAEQLLADHPTDVLVTDLQMPNGAGWQLMDTALLHHPDTARIVLSGRIDIADAAQMLSRAHQLLTKPCRCEVVIATIDRVLAVRRSIAHPATRRLLGSLTSLPRPATIANQICLATDADDPAQALTELIGTDQACCTDLIRIAHNPVFTHPAPIDSIQRAVHWVGIGPITSALLAQCRKAPTFPSTAGDPAGLAAQALQIATTARELARAENWPHETICTLFTAGLLHEFARPVLAGAPDATCTPAQASGYLLGLWGMPAHIIQTIAGQDLEARQPSVSATAILLRRAREQSMRQPAHRQG